MAKNRAIGELRIDNAKWAKGAASNPGVTELDLVLDVDDDNIAFGHAVLASTLDGKMFADLVKLDASGSTLTFEGERPLGRCWPGANSSGRQARKVGHQTVSAVQRSHVRTP